MIKSFSLSVWSYVHVFAWKLFSPVFFFALISVTVWGKLLLP